MFEFNLKLVNLLLEHASKNVVDLEKDDQCSEVHRLINDTFVLVSRRREHDE